MSPLVILERIKTAKREQVLQKVNNEKENQTPNNQIDLTQTANEAFADPAQETKQREEGTKSFSK